MAKVAPGFWTVWLWKLGMWGLVILFSFLYLGSVERHRGESRGDPAARIEPVAAADAGAGSGEIGVGAPVVELTKQATEAGVDPVSAKSVGLSDFDVSVSAPSGAMAEGLGQTTDGQNEPVPESVSQAEAQAFAHAVMSDTGAESVAAGHPGAVGDASGQLADAVVVSPEPVVQLPSQSQTVRDESGPAGGEQRVAVREAVAQRRARIMEEYRSMQRAAQDEMRNRWSSMGGFPYGAYPQWGYPPGISSRGYAPGGK